MYDDDNPGPRPSRNDPRYLAWLAAEEADAALDDRDQLTPEQERDCSDLVERSWNGETLTPEEAQRLHQYMQ